jgi:serine/threonine protein kinase
MQYKTIDKRYSELLCDIKRYFDKSDTVIWDRRNKIKIVDFSNERMVIKSFGRPHLINRIAYTFLRGSKAKRSYENSLKIEMFVPKPIGYSDYRRLGLIGESYFVSLHYPYDFTIREVITQKDFADRVAIFESFANFTYHLHEAGAEHLDYSPGNILIRRDKNGYAFKVIDINRMRFGSLTPRQRLENFAKLWASEEDLAVIARAYAVRLGIDPATAIEWATKASKKHKRKINMKKRIKGKKVVD